jgi:hypothetical protein
LETVGEHDEDYLIENGILISFVDSHGGGVANQQAPRATMQEEDQMEELKMDNVGTVHIFVHAHPLDEKSQEAVCTIDRERSLWLLSSCGCCWMTQF